MLTGKQLRFLRAMGTGIDPIIHIGKAGLVEALIKQMEEALEARELIKVRVLQNSPVEPRTIATELADAARAELVQVIGRNLLFFRQSEKKPTIVLPS
ncbi:MAG: putative RNA-binding protein YhbY family [bacterium]|nr:MAG: putative RNA-binding protein YhbY family [bacterium]